MNWGLHGLKGWLGFEELRLEGLKDGLAHFSREGGGGACGSNITVVWTSVFRRCENLCDM